MTVRKILLYFLLVPLGLSILGLLSFKRLSINADDLLIPLTVVGLWCLGLFLGVIISAIARKPRIEPYFYLSGQILMYLIVGVLVIYDSYKIRQHEKENGNVEDNRRMVNLAGDNPHDPYNSPNYVKTGYFKLESTFSDPNSIKLTRYTTAQRDTVIGFMQTTIPIVYFTYLKNNRELFSKVKIINDSAVIELLDVDTRHSEEYQTIVHAAERTLNENLENIRKEIKNLPDSSRKKIIDTIRKALQ